MSAKTSKKPRILPDLAAQAKLIKELEAKLAKAEAATAKSTLKVSSKGTFLSNLTEKGVNPAYLEMVNVREQCSWVHKDDHEGATQKTIDLIKGAIVRAKESVALESKQMKVIPEALVIGGGVAGITTSLRLSEFGMKVHLVEKRPSIGGHMIQYPKVFPTLDCSQCILTTKMASVSQSRNIDLMTYAEVEEVTGVPGDFLVKVKLRPRGVDIEKCIGCGM